MFDKDAGFGNAGVHFEEGIVDRLNEFYKTGRPLNAEYVTE